MRQNQGRGPEEAERWGDGENATSVRRERVWANTADGQRLRDDSGLGDTEAFEAFVGVASE